MKSLDTSLERLYQRRSKEIKLGLEPVRRLCELIGHPQDAFAVVHVAGTNGKGSVCAMIESVLRQAGFKVGLYTSPHMLRFNERIRINGNDVDDTMLADVLAECERAADQVLREQQHDATFFEITTAMAMLCFKRTGVQIAVLETGLGGRLDATNIVQPLVSVITRIALDHQAYLGNTLAAVAGEKAGIIKPGRPVVCGPQEPDVMPVLREAARHQDAPLVVASDVTSIQRVSGDLAGQTLRCETAGGWSGTVSVPLVGSHQIENAGIALAVLALIFSELHVDVPFSLVKAGLVGLRWRGRFETLCHSPLVIADAAHNPSGAQTLVATLKAHAISAVGLVTGMCSDKDVDGVVHALARVARAVWTVPLDNPRSIKPDDLTCKYKAKGVDAVSMARVSTALKGAISWARDEQMPIVIAGSIYLLGDVLHTETFKAGISHSPSKGPDSPSCP